MVTVTATDTEAVGAREGTLVCGGKGQGSDLDQLDVPRGIYVTEDRTVYVADSSNNRVMKWRSGDRRGCVWECP